MKITLEMQRGIGAGLPPLVIDTELLAPRDAADLIRLVAAAKAEKPAKQEGQVRETILVEDAGGSFELDQPITASAFAALRSWLREHAQQGTRGKN
jgi:hypothetical protein